MTFTKDINVYDVVNFILETAVNKYNGFPHWLAHLDYVRIILSEYKDIYLAKDKFQEFKKVISKNSIPKFFIVKLYQLFSYHLLIEKFLIGFHFLIHQVTIHFANFDNLMGEPNVL